MKNRDAKGYVPQPPPQPQVANALQEEVRGRVIEPVSGERQNDSSYIATLCYCLEMMTTWGPFEQVCSWGSSLVDEAREVAMNKPRGSLFELLDPVFLADKPLSSTIGSDLGLVVHAAEYGHDDYRYRVFWFDPDMRHRCSQQKRADFLEHELRLARGLNPPR